jgi:hypothetical protein
MNMSLEKSRFTKGQNALLKYYVPSSLGFGLFLSSTNLSNLSLLSLCKNHVVSSHCY